MHKGSDKRAYTGWQALANAVVEQAAEDWRMARRILDPDDPYLPKSSGSKDGIIIAAKHTIEETEEFFLSDRFDLFTEVDGPGLLRMLNEDYERRKLK